MMFIVVIGLVAVVDDVFDPLWLSLQIYAIIPIRQKTLLFQGAKYLQNSDNCQVKAIEDWLKMLLNWLNMVMSGNGVRKFG